MAKQKTSEIIRKKYTRSESMREAWLANKNHKWHGGDVVERNGSLGVVQFAMCDIETYKIKWYVGPNPWDFLETDSYLGGPDTVKSDKKNPLKYKWSQRVPGPSSDEIDKLEAHFAELNKKKMKDRTPKEVDIYVAALEEELVKKKTIEKEVNEAHADSIADKTLEEDTEMPRKNAVDAKIDNLLQEE
jgi:hypothetical protein